jgi:hypothetical protein
LQETDCHLFAVLGKTLEANVKRYTKDTVPISAREVHRLLKWFYGTGIMGRHWERALIELYDSLPSVKDINILFCLAHADIRSAQRICVRAAHRIERLRERAEREDDKNNTTVHVDKVAIDLKKVFKYLGVEELSFAGEITTVSFGRCQANETGTMADNTHLRLRTSLRSRPTSSSCCYPHQKSLPVHLDDAWSLPRVQRWCV